MMLSVNTQPIYDLIVQHPIASVLTVAFILVMCVLTAFFIIGVIKSK